MVSILGINLFGRKITDKETIKKLLSRIKNMDRFYLNSYLQEVNKKPICTSETQYIAERMTDMHLAGKDMLLCIGEILAVLNETKSPVEPLRSAMQLVDPDYLNALKQVPHVATNGRYAGVLPDSAPSYWHM